MEILETIIKEIDIDAPVREVRKGIFYIGIEFYWTPDQAKIETNNNWRCPDERRDDFHCHYINPSSWSKKYLS